MASAVSVVAPAALAAAAAGSAQPPARAAEDPWRAVPPVPDSVFSAIRARAIFECCKWDPHMEDEPAIARAPLVLRDETWTTLASHAERLAAETLAAERELLARPDLHRRLGLPRAVRRALAAAVVHPPAELPRLIRFDFHFTPAGWRISEANTDVPGGLNEASGFGPLFAPHYPGTRPVGDPVSAYADAIVTRAGAGARVALVHATAFTDDRQVMTFLSRALRQRSVRSELVSPSHVRWRDGRASYSCEWAEGDVDAIVRFFPGEWLPNLGYRLEWPRYFAGARTLLGNPATALLTQSKRFPLVWNELRTPMTAWRELLPETRDPRDCDWRAGEWVLKAALGRVGEDIGMRGVTLEKQWRTLARHARWWPSVWAAQRRFEAVSLESGDCPLYPCVGVYTVDGRAAGAYGRIARRPLIDWRAQDVAVLQVGDSSCVEIR